MAALKPQGRLAALLVVTAVLAISGQGSASGQEPPPQQLSEDFQLPPKPTYPGLDSQLNRMVEELAWRPVAAIADDAPLYQGDSVAVTIRLSSNVPAVVGFLEQNGATVANLGADYIEAYVPVTLLVALEGQSGVLRVETIIPPHPDVTSQGTTVHGSPTWNAQGFTGAGVKVGIIDVGFIGYGALMGTELPATVVARCYTAIGVFTANLADCEIDSDHGTAVAEAAVDIAPDVTLYIANPFSFTDLQTTASWMVSQGVQVINHSVGWGWQGPGDGTSHFSNTALDAVDIAVAGGTVWVNSAGNAAKDTWTGSFSDPDADDFHDYIGGDETNNINLSAGQSVLVQLRWDDSWPNASRDFDLLLFDDGLNLVAFSEDEQSGGPGHIPRERIDFTATTSGTYHITIARFSGSIPSWIQVQEFHGEDLEYAVAAQSIGNPAESANAGMLAVGAAYWATPNTIESFSSQGPTADGRVKPDIVGADGGNSASRGQWFGTSQASPHVAGLAALVLQRFPTFTPTQVADYLKANASPRGTVPNNTWGFGFAQAPSLSPGPPTNVTAVSGDGEATVTWSAPASDGGSTITQYTATSSPGGLTAAVDGTTLTATVTGLTNGTAYTFTVTATNAVGTSDPSAPSNAVTPLGPPEPPTNVTAVAGDAQATVSWSAPPSDGGNAITLYTVISNPEGLVATSTPASLTATVSGLTNGTAYTFTVTASNALGTSLPSASSSAVTPVGPPEPPTNVAATIGNGQAMVSWSAPAFDGGTPITQHTATSSPGGLTAAVDGSTLTATVRPPGLTNGTAYTFAVTATNAAGTSLPSAPSNTVTPLGSPDPPTNVAAVAGDEQAMMSWSAPRSDGGSPITLYTITSSPEERTATTTPLTLSATVIGLTKGTSYTFTVTASNAVGTSLPSALSNAVTPPLPPEPPIGVTPIAGDSEATVSWNAPPSDGGSPITLYTVTSNPEGRVATSTPPTLSATVTGLTNGTAYTFTVTATNAVGTSLPSISSNAVTPARQPDPPNNVVATAGEREAVVSWSAPAFDGGTPITQYTVTSSPGGLTANVDGSTLTATVTGLTNGTAYTFAVTATNAAGTSLPSAPSNAVTPVPVLASLAVTPPQVTLLVAGPLQFTATGTFSDGSTQDLTAMVTWASSDPAVVISAAVPSLSEWGVIGMVGLFAMLVLVGIRLQTRARHQAR